VNLAWKTINEVKVTINCGEYQRLEEIFSSDFGHDLAMTTGKNPVGLIISYPLQFRK
jgi:hypothetical protein